MAGNALGEFLQARRSELAPDSPTHTRRRVPGLRREEVALRAGVSVDYYTRIEQGRATEVSEAILQALADALELDESQRVYLDELTRPVASHDLGPSPQALRAVVDVIAAPAIVVDAAYDIHAANPAFAWFAGRPANLAEFIFLDRAAPDVIGEWETAAHATISRLRHQLARRPGHERLHALVRRLSRDSAWFAAHWNEAQMSGIFGGPGQLRRDGLDYGFELVTLTAAVDADRTIMVWAPADAAAGEALGERVRARMERRGDTPSG